jgi:hypothetical protein
MPLHRNHLLVEDHDTNGAVIGLLRHHIDWPRDETGWPAKIEILGSSKAVLNKRELDLKLKESGLEVLGLVVDADTSFKGRWSAIRDVCSHLGATPPTTCPQQGLILQVGTKRLGVWIMPDNQSNGMLEDFARTLVPPDASALHAFAQTSADDAKKKGASYRKVHTEKAYIHTWLSWQDPPGERIGNAITKNMLQHDSSTAMAFVNWFKLLFNK